MNFSLRKLLEVRIEGSASLDDADGLLIVAALEQSDSFESASFGGCLAP